MQHRVEVAVELEHDPLPDAPQAADRPAVEGFHRRVDGPQQEGLASRR